MEKHHYVEVFHHSKCVLRSVLLHSARRPSTAIDGNSRRLSMPAHIAPLTIKISLADSDSLDKGKAIYSNCKQIYWLVDGVRYTRRELRFKQYIAICYISLNAGWVVHAEETQDPEMATLRIWDRKSKERLRKRSALHVIREYTVLCMYVCMYVCGCMHMRIQSGCMCP